MEGLISRLEASLGPCIELDEAIADIVFSDAAWQLEAEPYTSSIDAAMTLVPEGCAWVTGSVGFARLINIYHDPVSSAEAATPALALCAAALRARRG